MTLRERWENSPGAIGVTAPPVPEAAKTNAGLNSLQKRILSAVVLAIPVIVCVSIGSPLIESLVVGAALVLVWEWCRLCSNTFSYRNAALLAAVITAAILTVAFDHAFAAIVVLVAGGIAIHLLTGGHVWLSVGAFYIGLPCVAVVWLRSDPVLGRETLFWLLALVWASDVGGYVFGRLIGGRKLAPAWSPNKTWAGFAGAAACGAIAGAATALIIKGPSFWPLVGLSALLGGATQGGDLFESWVKRHFGVKDTSALIPGHGGLLDRVDGLLAASALTALLGVIGNGSILRWI
jgi:phosphatidate cytidylyltransferase